MAIRHSLVEWPRILKPARAAITTIEGQTPSVNIRGTARLTGERGEEEGEGEKSLEASRRKETRSNAPGVVYQFIR